MREKRKTLDKKSNNLNLKKIAKKQRLQERGITLIALVVTIIILLILSGVTLNIALSDGGLFSKTKKAAEDYKEAQSDEEDAIRQISTQLYSEYVGATVEGYSPADNKSGVKIEKTTSGLDSNKDSEGKEITGVADDGSQTFEAEEMSWRVWDFDGSILRIIGDQTTAKLKLKGAAGYNNGVWAIDNICRTLYSNEAKGAKATNLKRTDIQKVSTYDYTQYKHEPIDWHDVTEGGTENVIHFGETKTYDDNYQYPAMWNENDREWTYEYDKGKKTANGGDKECKKWEIIGDGKLDNTMNEGNSDTEFRQSYYAHDYKENDFINREYYDLIFKNTNGDNIDLYWLEGRYAFLRENSCNFGMQVVEITRGLKVVGGAGMIDSDNEKIGSSTLSLRPIVSIDLESNGYTMTSEIGEDGKMKIILN